MRFTGMQALLLSVLSTSSYAGDGAVEAFKAAAQASGRETECFVIHIDLFDSALPRYQLSGSGEKSNLVVYTNDSSRCRFSYDPSSNEFTNRGCNNSADPSELSRYKLTSDATLIDLNQDRFPELLLVAPIEKQITQSLQQKLNRAAPESFKVEVQAQNSLNFCRFKAQ